MFKMKFCGIKVSVSFSIKNMSCFKCAVFLVLLLIDVFLFLFSAMMSMPKPCYDSCVSLNNFLDRIC